MPAVSNSLFRAQDRYLVTSNLRTAPTPFRLTLLPMSPALLPFVSYTVFWNYEHIEIYVERPGYTNIRTSLYLESPLSPAAAAIRSGLRKRRSLASLPCRPSQGMCIRAPSLVVHVALRREFLLRCKVVGIPPILCDINIVVYASVDRVFHMPSHPPTSFVLFSFGIRSLYSISSQSY